MRNRPRRTLAVLLLAVGLVSAFAGPAFAAKPDHTRKSVNFEGSRFEYSPFGEFPELDESLRSFSVTVYDGRWQLARGQRAEAAAVGFWGQWATCEAYTNPDIPAADAVIRVYDWQDTETLDAPEEGTVSFTDDGYAGALDITVEIEGTYLAIPALALGPPGDPFTTCEGVTEPVVSTPITRTLALGMAWESLLGPGRGKEPKWESTTVTAVTGTFGGQALHLPHGDSESYYARSGPYRGYVDHS